MQRSYQQSEAIIDQNTLNNQCAKFEPSTTKDVRDIALQSMQPSSNYFEN